MSWFGRFLASIDDIWVARIIATGALVGVMLATLMVGIRIHDHGVQDGIDKAMAQGVVMLIDSALVNVEAAEWMRDRLIEFINATITCADCP